MRNTSATTAEKTLRDEMRGLNGSGSITGLATRDVVTIPPTSSIKSSVELMVNNRFRRLPVTDAGTGRLLGIFGSSDVVDLLGGGRKYTLISEAHKGNFLSAINDSVRQVMNTQVLTALEDCTINEGLDLLLSSKRGGLIVVDKKNKIKGIVTERDYVEAAYEECPPQSIETIMTSKVITTTPGTTLGDAAKIMTRNSFRRLPVVSEERLVGMVTTRTILNYIGQNGVFTGLVKNDPAEIIDRRVSTFMSHDIAAVPAESKLKDALELMHSTGKGTVCVVNGDEGLQGIVTERDVVRNLAS